MSKKTVALLNFSFETDQQIKNTFEYYFNNPKCLFRRFPIVNTRGNIGETLSLLDEYYGKGKRIFIGFTTSNAVSAVSSWFRDHPKAKAISLYSTAALPEKPTNIYRLVPSDELVFSVIGFSPYYLERRYIFYIYSDNQRACLDFLRFLEQNPIIKQKLIPIPITENGSNINDVRIQYTDYGADPQLDATTVYLFVNDQRQQFIDLFNPLFLPIPTFDVSLQTVPDGLSFIWDSLYFSYQIINVSTSPLWRDGQTAIGFVHYSSQALNALQLAKFFNESKFPLSTLSNYAFVVEFDTVNDAKYFSLSSYIWKDTTWLADSILFLDPLFGLIFQTDIAPSQLKIAAKSD